MYTKQRLRNGRENIYSKRQICYHIRIRAFSFSWSSAIESYVGISSYAQRIRTNQWLDLVIACLQFFLSTYCLLHKLVCESKRLQRSSHAQFFSLITSMYNILFYLNIIILQEIVCVIRSLTLPFLLSIFFVFLFNHLCLFHFFFCGCLNYFLSRFKKFSL